LASYLKSPDIRNLLAQSMFIQRLLVVLVFGPAALFAIYRGGLFYFLPLAIILVLATIEYSQIMQRLGWQVSSWLLIPAVLVQLAAGQWPASNYFAPLLVISLLAVLGYSLWLYERSLSRTAPADWLAMSAGILFLGWIGSHFFRLRGLEQMAWQWTMLAMVGTWVADSAAYVVGRFMAGKVVLGRHQLTPRLSPNKTVEGYVAGIVVGTALMALMAHWLRLPPGAGLVLGLVITVLSPLGDLGISLLKREAGVKDSGNLFPGHGGALDRLDSLIWSVTMAYYLALSFG